jgi:hypothetical protein
MKTYIYALLIAALCLGVSNVCATAYSGGSGSSGDPYLISSAAEINIIGSTPSDWNKYFKLTANIDMSSYTGTSYKIIGNPTTTFTGGFDGNGYVISNLTYSTALATSQVGMFGSTDHATIKNISLVNVNISSPGSNIGGLIGYQNYGTVTNCSTTGSVSGAEAVGGLVGHTYGDSVSKILNCYSTASVTATCCKVGGLIGFCLNPVSNCYSSGNVTATSGTTVYLGGLIGELYYEPVDNCYSTSAVTGSSTSYCMGGLTGYEYETSISNCYSTGTITGGTSNSSVGGLVGSLSASTVTNCYSVGYISMTSNSTIGGLIGTAFSSTTTASFWDIDTSGQTISAGGTGETDTAMKTSSTFTSAGWDFDWSDGSAVWIMPVEGSTYPVLSWQSSVYGGGNGTSSYPWQIYTLSQLLYVGSHPADYDKYFIVMADINMTGTTYTQAIIAPDTDNATGGFQGTGFNGNFNGNGHKISNMTMNMTAGDFAGLFGYVYGSGQVLNLGVEDVNVSGRQSAAGLMGANSGTVSGCYATGTVSGSDYYVGGLIGWNGGTVSGCYATSSVSGYYYAGGLTGYSNASGAVSNSYATGAVGGSSYIGGLIGDNLGSVSSKCYATGAVTGSTEIGGLVGENENSGTVDHCYAEGAVSGVVFFSHNSYYVGGLIGYNSGTVTYCYEQGSVTRQGVGGSLLDAGGLVGYNDANITSCYARGAVSGSSYVGGLVGYNYGSTTNGCYSTGSVSGGTNVGGLVGYNNSGSITNCFWDTETSGQPTSAGGTGKTTAEMKTESTFTSAGWDFAWAGIDGDSADWVLWIAGQSYPTLAWQPATFGGGSGTSGDPWKIATRQHLLFLAYNSAYYSGSYIMTSDIDMSEYTGTMYRPIGYASGLRHYYFTGTFDGGGHIISNLTYSTESSAANVGMFGYTSSATIKNLGLEGVTINTMGDTVGGLVGYQYRGYVNNCYTTGSVSGQGSVGGLVGAELGSINNSYSLAAVTGTNAVGGLVGGISGYLLYGVRTSYSAGRVIGDTNVGGLIGYSNSGLVQNSFWDIQTSHQGTSAGGTGQLHANMRIKSTFTNATWDFLGETTNGTNDYWRMCVDGVSYPLLTWEFNKYGDFTCPDGADFVDFAILAAAWRTSTGGAGWNPICDISATTDGQINLFDLSVFAANWLQ